MMMMSSSEMGRHEKQPPPPKKKKKKREVSRIVLNFLICFYSTFIEMDGSLKSNRSSERISQGTSSPESCDFVGQGGGFFIMSRLWFLNLVSITLT